MTLYDWLANTITSGLGKVLSLGLRKLILGLHTNEDPTGPVGWPCMNIYKSEKKNLKYINLKQECFRPLENYDYTSPPHNGVLFYRRYSLFSWHPRVDENSPIEVCHEIKNSEIFNK